MSYLYDIRAAVARLCNDWVEIEATSDSASVNVVVDNVAGYENDNHFRGSDVWATIGTTTVANRGLVVRSTGSTLSTTSLDLGNGLASAPVTGDTFWLFNIGGTGERIRTYDAIINDAIRNLGASGDIPYTYDLTDEYVVEEPWIDIPTEFTALSKVQYYDSDEIWYDIPNHSITVDTIQRKLALTSEYAYLSDDKLLRLVGKKKHPALSADDDETNLDFEWITNEAASQILMNKRDQASMNKGGLRKNSADAVRGKVSIHGLLEGSIRLT